MTERQWSSAGRRSWRLPVVLALLVLPVGMSAQQGTCRAQPTQPVSVTQYVWPSVALALRDSTLILGGISVRFDSSEERRSGPPDTSVAGVLLAADRGLRAIPRPPGARAFVEPRAFARGDEVTVLWSERDPESPTEPDRRLLRTARLTRTGWGAIRTIGSHRIFGELTREVGSDLIRLGDRHWMAFPISDSLAPETPIVVMSESGGAWETQRVSLGTRLTTSVALGVADGQLLAAFTGVPTGRAVRGRVISTQVWVSKRLPGGWTRAALLGGSDAHGSRDPMLLPATGGLIASWITDEAEPVLEWRFVAASGSADGPVHRFPGVALVSQGVAPYRDLVSVLQPDRSLHVLRLHADGFERVATLSASAMWTAVVARWNGQPWALGPEVVEAAGRSDVRLVAYDLRCALRR